MQNALANLSMANLAAIARGEDVSGIRSVVGQFDDDDYDEYDDVEGISGDGVDGIDDSDVIGAMSPAARIKLQKKQLAAMKKALVKARKGGFAGRKVLPIEATAVAAGATATIQARPNHSFKAQRLVLATAIAAGFTIQNIVIRGKSQLEATGTVPGELFGATAADVNFIFDECPPNSTIDLQVTNDTAGALTFVGSFLGLVR